MMELGAGMFLVLVGAGIAALLVAKAEEIMERTKGKKQERQVQEDRHA